MLRPVLKASTGAKLCTRLRHAEDGFEEREDYQIDPGDRGRAALMV